MEEEPKRRVKLVTSWTTLFNLAKEAAEARKGDDPEEAKRKQEAHDAYQRLCIKADYMIDGPSIHF